MPPFPDRPLRALLLDLDGTVLDTHELIFRCFRETLLEVAGLEPDRAAWQRALGLPLAELFTGALAAADRPTELADELVSVYRKRMAALDEEVQPFPAIPETLQALRDRGVLLAIVTTKHGTLARRHLETTGLAPLFAAVVTGEECARCKPHPEPFLLALERVGVGAGEAAGVGDSAFDVRGSRAAGMRAGAALWGAMDPEALLAAHPDLRLDLPEHLLRIA